LGSEPSQVPFYAFFAVDPENGTCPLNTLNNAKQREQGQADAPERAFIRTVKPGSLLNSAPFHRSAPDRILTTWLGL
jgi:hypothetical protein